MDKKFKRLFKDTIVFALGSLGSKMILFFLVPLYTNFLSTEEYAIADLVSTTVQLIVPVVSVVIFEAVIRFGLMKNKNPAEVLKAGLLVGTIGCAFTVLATPLWALYKPLSPWKWYLCMYVVLNYTATIFKSYLKVKDRNKRFALVSVVETLCLALMNILLLTVFKVGIMGYLLSNIVAAGISVSLAILMGNAVGDIMKAKLNTSLMKEMLKYSAPLILNDISWWVIHSSDKYMIEALVSASALGLYTAATKIPSLINVLISIFGQAWNISSIKEVESTNDMDFCSKVFKCYTLLTFSACVFLVSIIRPFMDIYVGKKFEEAWKYVSLLLVSAVFASIASYYGQLYAALKKSMNNMVTTLTAAIVNFAVNLALIPVLDIWGAVIGTVVAYIVLAFVRMKDAGKYVELQIDHFRVFVNSAIIISQSILISLNFHILPVAVASVVLFGIINFKTFNEVRSFIRERS